VPRRSLDFAEVPEFELLGAPESPPERQNPGAKHEFWTL
jgi:hypothetical protein